MCTVFILFLSHSPYLVLLLCLSTLHQIYDLFFWLFMQIYSYRCMYIHIYIKYIYIHMHIYIYNNLWVHLISLKFFSLWGNLCLGNISNQQLLSGEVMKPRGQRANACFVSKYNSQLYLSLCTYINVAPIC